MFVVEITSEAQAEIVKQFALGVFTKPGLMIERKGPIGELTRLSDGEASWAIERPRPWRAEVVELQAFDEDSRGVSLVNGISVWLKLGAYPGTSGVKVSIRAGQFVVEPRVA